MVGPYVFCLLFAVLLGQLVRKGTCLSEDYDGGTNAKKSTTPPSNETENEGQLTITVVPSNWLNYTTTNANVTFAFDPPCAGATIWEQTAYGTKVCVIGPGCSKTRFPNFNTSSNGSLVESITAFNITSKANGLYNGRCSDNTVYYTSFEKRHNLVVGVNPRILRFQIGVTSRGIFGTMSNYTFQRAPNSDPTKHDHFKRLRAVPVGNTGYGSSSSSSSSRINLVFGVGKGHNPERAKEKTTTSSTTTRGTTDFFFTQSFEVYQSGGSVVPVQHWPSYRFRVSEFDHPHARYPFIKKNLALSSKPMVDVVPYGEWVTYSFRASDLVENEVCSVKTKASVELFDAPVRDEVEILVNFTYKAAISSITVLRNPQQCACVFSCNVIACPSSRLPPGLSYEWAFYDSHRAFKINYTRADPHDPSNPQQFIVDKRECQRMYKKRYSVRCRFSDPNIQVDSSINNNYKMAAMSDLLRSCRPETEFECPTTLQCIPLAAKCNGRNDCEDGADERNCTRIKQCPHGQFQCKSTAQVQCIEQHEVCDSVPTCADGSDEENCDEIKTPCPVGSLSCANRRCILATSLCGLLSGYCPDLDTKFCIRNGSSSCSRRSFHCDGGNTCLGSSKICDSRRDCVDGSDESLCGTYYNRRCSRGFWKCKTGSQCVYASRLCDGVRNCKDGSDEESCAIGNPGYRTKATARHRTTTRSIRSVNLASCDSEDYFRCNDSSCIPMYRTCDGVDNCDDSSDEGPAACQHCPKSRPFHCDNHRCITLHRVCDGRNNCGDNSDESETICGVGCTSSGMFRCKQTGKCIHKGLLCNNALNCGDLDRSDETPQACQLAEANARLNPSCPSGTIKCASNNRCVPVRHLCDGVSQCCHKSSESSSRRHPTLSSLFSEETTTVDYYMITRDDSLEVLPSPSASENETHVGTCEKTDELGCVPGKACSQNNGDCNRDARCVDVVMPKQSDICSVERERTEGVYCTCAEGYRRDGTESTSPCVDIDECSLPLAAKCSHNCANSDGSFACSCADGFVEKQIDGFNGTTGLCVPKDSTDDKVIPDVVLIYDDTIRLLEYPDNNRIIATTTFTTEFQAFDVDIRNAAIVYAEVNNPLLERTTLPLGPNDKPVTIPLIEGIRFNLVTGLAIDFIGNNLYVADANHGQSGDQFSRVVVSLTDGRYQKTLFKTEHIISAIAINPLLGRLYYSLYDWKSPVTVSIVMASMNGSVSGKQEIWKNSNNPRQVESLAVDYLGKGRLYFSDGPSIMVANSDGSNLQALEAKFQAPALRAFDIFGNMLYGLMDRHTALGAKGRIQRWNTPRILYEIDKFGRDIYANLTTPMGNAGNVRIYHPLKAGPQQAWPKPCAGLGCSHICLLDMDGGAACYCPDGSVGGDQKTCKAPKLPELVHPSSGGSTEAVAARATESGSGVLKALVALVVIMLVVLLIFAAAGIYCWQRRRAAAADQFNSMPLASISREAIDSDAISNN